MVPAATVALITGCITGCALRINESGSEDSASVGDSSDTLGSDSVGTTISTTVGTDTFGEDEGFDEGVDEGLDWGEEGVDMNVGDEGNVFIDLLDMDLPDECVETTGSVEAFNDAELSGLEQVVAIEGDLFIGGDVTDLGALRCLTKVDGVIFIGDTSALTNLNGLERLDYAGGIFILNNESLNSLQALDRDEIWIENTLEIIENPDLGTCESRQFHNALDPKPFGVCIQSNRQDACLDLC